MTNARLPISPALSLRPSIRPVARTSDIDFDKIPSPRPKTPSQRNARNGIPGPSSAVKTSALKYTRIPEPDSGSPDPGDQDTGMSPDLFDDYAPQNSRSPPQSKSFGRIEADEDDDEQEQEVFPYGTPLKNKKGKGKQRATLYEEPDQDAVEDGIAQELEDVDSDDNEEIEPEPQEPVKKDKTVAKNPRKPQTESRSRKENRCVLFASLRLLYLS